MTPDEVLAESTQEPGGWKHKCGGDLHQVLVAHPVWTNPEMCAGSGDVQTQTVPYCPACHEKPSAAGRPITPKDTDWPPVMIKEKV